VAVFKMRLDFLSWGWITISVLLLPLRLLGQDQAWITVSPAANRVYQHTQNLLRIGATDSAFEYLRGAYFDHSYDNSPETKLLFGHEIIKILTKQRQFEAAQSCLATWKSPPYPKFLEHSRDARLLVYDAYVSLALELEPLPAKGTAIRICQKATSEMPSNHPLKAHFEHNLGLLFVQIKDRPSAIATFESSLHSTQQSIEARLRNLDELTLTYILNKDSILAAKSMAEAESCFAKCHSLDSEDSLVHEYCLGKFAQTNDDFASAEMHFNKALHASRSLDVNASRDLNRLDFSFGFLKSLEGDFEDALPYFSRHLTYKTIRQASPSSKVQVYNCIGECYHYLGNYEKAAENYRFALEALNADPDAPMYKKATANVNYGQELLNRGEFETALNHLEKGIALYKEFDSTFYRGIGTGYMNIGFGQMQQRHWQAAIQAYEKGYFYFGMENPIHWDDIAYVKIGAANALVKLNRLEEADNAYREAVGAIEKIKRASKMDQVLPLTDVTEYLIEASQFDAAIAVNERVMHLLFFGESDPSATLTLNFEHYISPWYAIAAAGQRAEILRGKYRQSGNLHDLQQSLPYIQAALKLLRRLRQDQNNDEEKLRANQHWAHLFENGIRNTVELFDRSNDPAYLAQAFEIAEQSKAMILLEAVIENGALGRDPLFVAKKRLIQQRSALLQQVASGLQSITQIKDSLRFLDQDLASVVQSIKQKYPRYSELVYDFDIVSVPQLQAKLRKDHRALIEYFWGDSTVFTFCLTPETLVVRQMALESPFVDSLLALAKSQNTSPEPNQPASNYARNSEMLVQALWPAELIGAYSHVTIVPDGPLSFISFDGLSRNRPPQGRQGFKHLHYFVEDYVISYQYSGTFMSHETPRETNGAAKILAMAPEFVGAESLPFAKEGIENISHTFPGTVSFVGAAATKRRFLEEASKYQVLLLATHGSVDRSNPMESKLFFSHDQDGDTVLKLEDLYGLNLQSQLAILDACETGTGDYKSGEGVMSLARGFTYAGCKSILMSLWKVPESEANSNIIGDILQKLSEGKPADEAITFAKREFLAAARANGGQSNDYISPYFWSELVLIGETANVPIPTPVASRNPIPYVFGAIGILGLLLVGYFWRRKK
jgi:CHAT domain-containing protein